MSGGERGSALPERPRVTVVIPCFNSSAWLPACLDALERQTLRRFRLIVVDDGSTDDSVAVVGRHSPRAEILALGRNRGFAPAVNAGIRHTDDGYVMLLNADTRAEPDWLERMVDRLDRSPPEVAGVACKMLHMDRPELVEDAGNSLSWYGTATKRGRDRPATEYDEPGEVFSVCAGAALYRRRLFDDVGLFDESFRTYLEDVELGLRARLAGHRFVYEPGARIRHQGHSSGLARGRYVAQMTRNRLLMLVKCVPARLLLRHLRQLLFGQFYFFIAYRRPHRSLEGYLRFLAALPRALRARRRILARRELPLEELERALASELLEPPLRELARRRWRRLRRRPRGRR